MNIDSTSLQVIEFGEDESDKFYCLIDLNISSAGMNIDKLKLSDPRNFDHQFKESGCLLMLTGDEVKELINRGDLDKENLHRSLYKIALDEGIIKKNQEN